MMKWDTSHNHLKKNIIPTPNILIKDHNILTRKGYFPTRLIIQPAILLDTCAKVGYLGLENIMDTNDMNYTKFKTVHESKVKGKL